MVISRGPFVPLSFKVTKFTFREGGTERERNREEGEKGKLRFELIKISLCGVLIILSF